MGSPSGGAPASGRGAGRRRLRPRELLDALQSHKVSFVVIGGMSLAAHGYVRATKDIDIVPDPEPGNLDRLAAALRTLDAAVDIGDIRAGELGIEPDEEGLRAGGNWTLQTRYGRLDVMQDVPGLRNYRELQAGAVEIDGVRYAGYDQLVSMKTAAGRDEDIRDLGALAAARHDEEHNRD